MRSCLLISFIVLFGSATNIYAQCSALGQNPSTAFPVCGIGTFQQTTVPICTSNSLFVPGCTNSDNANYANKNPFWYKFTCYQSGTLAFTITPNVLSDDYDWQLYDITGYNPDAVFSNQSLVIAGNWSGSSGTTGASSTGLAGIQCASNPSQNAPTFAALVNLVAGHDYLLLISHFTDTQSGYSLSFGGSASTASITDPSIPKMDNAVAPCDGSVVIINLNKKLKCSSISTGEFTISPALATVSSVTGNGCALGFDMSQLTLNLSTSLPPGNYWIRINRGSDGNTLLDYCDKSIPENDSVQLIVAPVFPTPMDSITKPACSPQTLELVFKKRIRCSSVASDGSDFIVRDLSGVVPVTVTAAAGGNCIDGLSSNIIVSLSAALQKKGTFEIRLQQGGDHNTIVDECGQETPAGQILNFEIKDTVNADFSSVIKLGCVLDTVAYAHNGLNEVNSWLWNFDNLYNSSLQNPAVAYNVFGNHNTVLIVSNGVCSDTLSKDIFLRNTLNAKFDATLLVCPNDPASFKDQSQEASPGNNIVTWSWNFANGNTSMLQNPPAQFYTYQAADYYAPVQLIVQDFLGCKDTALINLNILHNCYIAVPSAFTPNGDGLNDYLYPLNAYKAINLRFSIFNRLGQKIFDTQNWKIKWDGKFRGQDADPGTYVWMLDFFDTESNKRVFQKGYTVLIR
ncbi:MAG: gliding motility-associated C-terminal domain-containing protein [Ferruginibacter sp.]